MSHKPVTETIRSLTTKIRQGKNKKKTILPLAPKRKDYKKNDQG